MLERRDDAAQVSCERDRRKGGGQGKLVGHHVVWVWVGVDVSARRGRSRGQRCRSRACSRRVDERLERQGCEVSAALVNPVRDAPRLLLGSSSCRSGDSSRSAECRKNISICTASAAARHGQLHRAMRTHGVHFRKPPKSGVGLPEELKSAAAASRMSEPTMCSARDVFVSRWPLRRLK